MGKSFVYFMLSRIDNEPAIKIGMSWKPRLRAVAIRRQLGQPVTVVANIPFKDEYGARLAERGLHNSFSDHRIQGEWFRPARSILQLIDECSAYAIDPWGKHV